MKNHKWLCNNFNNFIDNKFHLTSYQKHQLGQWLRVIHAFIAFFLTSVMILSNNFNTILSVFICLILIIISFYYFNGCIMTHLEYQLTQDKMTIVDPGLYFLGFDINNYNRVMITGVFIFLCLCFSLGKLYYIFL